MHNELKKIMSTVMPPVDTDDRASDKENNGDNDGGERRSH